MTDKTSSVGFLRIRQSEISVTFSAAYDFLLTVVGWESRALAALPIFTNSTGPVLALRFKSQDSEIETQKIEINRKFLEGLNSRFEAVQLLETTNFSQNCSDIESYFSKHFSQVGRPLRVLVDMSCLPKRYLLFILGLGFRNEYISSFDFIYAEGRYDVRSIKSNLVNSVSGLISRGDWATLQIPYMEGQSYSPSERDLCLSLGAEISAALPYIDRFEPKRLFLFPIAENDELMKSEELANESKALQELQNLPNARSEAFKLNDVAGLATQISSLVRSSTTCLSIGSKTHALALGIASLANDAIEVVCRVPFSYTGIDVTSTGRLFRFQVEDRFEPLTYLLEC
jgi:hypothetical protein